MVQHLEKLNQLVADKLVDLNDFYCISFDNQKLDLQGDFSMESFKKYEALVDLDFDKESKWFKGTKDRVRIVLTF